MAPAGDGSCFQLQKRGVFYVLDTFQSTVKKVLTFPKKVSFYYVSDTYHGHRLHLTYALNLMQNNYYGSAL